MKKRVSALMIILACVIFQKTYSYPTILAATDTTIGLKWETLNRKYKSNNLHDITYNENNVYIAVGEEGMILRSTDKNDWKEVSINTTKEFNTVVTNGSDFVVAGREGIILYSSNGVKWKKGTISFPKHLTSKDIYKKDTSSIDKNYTVNWNNKPKQYQLEIKDILWDGKQFVGIGTWEITGIEKKSSYSSISQIHIRRGFVITSMDGKNWDAKQIELEDAKKIIYTGKQYVVVSDEDIAFSLDLKKWRITSPKIRGDIVDIIYSNGKYTVISWDGNISAIAGAIHTSIDGIKWKEVFNKEQIGSASYEIDDTIKLYGKANGFSNISMSSLLWDGNQYVIAGYLGMILVSETGSNWKLINERWQVPQVPLQYKDLSGARANIQKIIFDGEHYISVGNNGTILVSDNLNKGVVARTRPSADYTDIVYDGDSLYLAYGYEGDLLESKDGYTWKQVYIEGVSPDLNWEGIAAHNGTAIAVCNEDFSNEAYYYYLDKSGNWSKMKFPDKVGIVRNVMYKEGKYYISAKNGIITSKDGKTWSKYILKNNPMRDFTFNGRIYIGQKSFITGNISNNALYYSTDFKKWSKVSVIKNKKKYYLSAEEVIWNGKYFVTIGGMLHDNHAYDGDYVTGISKDGIVWETLEAKLHLEGGTYANNLYVAYDYSGNIYTSKNGIDYVKNTKPTKQRLRAVLWDGEKFLLAGNMGVIISSVDENTKIPEPEEWKETKEEYYLIYR